ncbi:YbaB/EbfC family nucleoid-associated protein [Candidatus Borreliella tachyglossi]|uniref:YbaB/EbfC family nucleoid-associated protein n=1 Tax=Candidatus Borreliella tachyglossi TaxID=1964448 RepID=A0A2S1LX16_9SPIR|nr:YbaB/EbfC family nucleoid-associated protein [Candidatus Borreliella tachyglossi]AWG42834.1 YbaB/EbfC family nucleoid-associated protein [Candidatus Borreliella tachyglossi]
MSVNPLDFLKNMSNFKDNIDNIKKEISQISVYGRAGSDVVIVEMNGEFLVKKVTVKEEFFSDLDNEALEHMIKAAFNDAISKVKEEIKTKTMGSIPFGI